MSNPPNSPVVPRVALVHDFLHTFGGAERVLKTLTEMFPAAPVYTLLASPQVVASHFPNSTIHTSPLQRSPLRKWPHLLIAAMPQAIETFNLSTYNVVISSSGAFSHGVLTGPETRHICYCHSPMRYAWDWHREYLDDRGIGQGALRFAAESVMTRLRTWDQVSARRVDTWVANSQTVQERLSRYYHVESEVIYPPVDTDFFNSNTTPIVDNQPTYAVTVGRLSSYKRVEIMIQACAAAKIPLKVVGEGPDRKRLSRCAQKYAAEVSFLGRLGDTETRKIVANARCFLFAAEDDFGITPVEALSLGVPVLALARGGARETVREGENGWFFTEPTAQSLEQTLRHFLSEGVAFTPAQICETALRFSHARFTSAIHNLL